MNSKANYKTPRGAASYTAKIFKTKTMIRQNKIKTNETHHTDTVEINGQELEVSFTYWPEEPAERGPEAQYPGCAAEIEINVVIDENGNDITELLSEKTLENINAELFNWL